MRFDQRLKDIAHIAVPQDKAGTPQGLFHLWAHLPHVDPVAPRQTAPVVIPTLDGTSVNAPNVIA